MTRAEIESHAGASFVLPGDLEAIMPSFKGRLTLNEDGAEWWIP